MLSSIKPNNVKILDVKKRSAITKFVYSKLKDYRNLPISVDKNILKDIKKEKSQFFISPKLDGVRYLFILFRDEIFTNKNICVMINRRNDIYEIPVSVFDVTFFNGTIFDGELVLKNGSLTFVAFDCYCFKGKNLFNLPFSKRILGKLSCFDNQNAPDINGKQYEEYMKNLLEFFRENENNIIPNVPNMVGGIKVEFTKQTYLNLGDARNLDLLKHYSNFDIDGIIFTHSQSKVKDKKTYKWKKTNTIDVFCDEGGNVICSKNGVKVNINKDKDYKGYLFYFNDETITRNTHPYECICSLKGNKIFLKKMRIRVEKLKANDISTIYKKINSIKENITFNKLVQYLS